MGQSRLRPQDPALGRGAARIAEHDGGGENDAEGGAADPVTVTIMTCETSFARPAWKIYLLPSVGFSCVSDRLRKSMHLHHPLRRPERERNRQDRRENPPARPDDIRNPGRLRLSQNL